MEKVNDENIDNNNDENEDVNDYEKEMINKGMQLVYYNNNNNQLKISNLHLI